MFGYRCNKVHKYWILAETRSWNYWTIHWNQEISRQNTYIMLLSILVCKLCSWINRDLVYMCYGPTLVVYTLHMWRSLMVQWMGRGAWNVLSLKHISIHSTDLSLVLNWSDLCNMSSLDSFHFVTWVSSFNGLLPHVDFILCLLIGHAFI